MSDNNDVQNTETIETAGTVDVEPLPAPAEPKFGTRPWHGSSNPMEAIFQWVKDELAKLTPPPAPTPAAAPDPNAQATPAWTAPGPVVVGTSDTDTHG